MTSTTQLLPAPGIAPELEPAFRPAVLFNRAFRALTAATPGSPAVGLVLEQADGSRFRFETAVLPEAHPRSSDNLFFLERMIKFLLWSRGGHRLYLAAPASLTRRIREHFATTSTGKFDAEIMGSRIYEQPFEVVACSPDELPAPCETTKPLGRHLKGCRIGFDLGASDRKVAALIDGEVVFSEESPWSPVGETDPQWHFDQIMDSLKQGARHLPRVDAIGGSSAGVIVSNRIKVASLFRGVPRPLFETRVKNIFLELKAAWKGIPFEVVNDGEVTALAGSMSLGVNSLLGVAMGSSEAVGYVTPEGNITSWLNELAFAPVDCNPEAVADEWSGDRGVGALYFSQQAVGRLVGKAGIPLPTEMTLPVRLEQVQALMKNADPRAARIYRTIGTYLGYTIAHYADYYALQHLLILGRVTSGYGGTLLLDTAKAVLEQEFPELAEQVHIHIPDEKMKRHGQAVAAASLPMA
ncbi:MAG: ROK family protein [Kiritimatiellia bacterium]